MTSQTERLERLLGGKIEQLEQRTTPGLVPVEGVEVVYFSLSPKGNARQQFKKITSYTNPPFAQNGGVSESGCHIQSPDGGVFRAISYHGDLEGWKQDIEAGASAFNAVLAKIENGNLVLSDGRSYDLDKCRIEFC
jgi:hypothetical protein